MLCAVKGARAILPWSRTIHHSRAQPEPLCSDGWLAWDRLSWAGRQNPAAVTLLWVLLCCLCAQCTCPFGRAFALGIAREDHPPPPVQHAQAARNCWHSQSWLLLARAAGVYHFSHNSIQIHYSQGGCCCHGGAAPRLHPFKCPWNACPNMSAVTASVCPIVVPSR